jgi:hypothetical protein
MAYQISDKTKKQTTKCLSSFHCLDDEKIDICSVKWNLDGNGCFLKTVPPNGCPYKLQFGSSYMCKCPTRHELFKKYKI